MRRFKSRIMKSISAFVVVACIMCTYNNINAATVYSLYRNWSLYYTGTSTGSHTYESFTMPVYNHYKFVSTSGNLGYMCKCSISVNGVVKTIHAAGVVATFDYECNSQPQIVMQLVDYSGTTSRGINGTLSVAND